MSPEFIGSNIWKLLEGEVVTDKTGETIEGPAIVRVHEFPEVGKLRIKQGPKALEVDGNNFTDVVSRKAN